MPHLDLEHLIPSAEDAHRQFPHHPQVTITMAAIAEYRGNDAIYALPPCQHLLVPEDLRAINDLHNKPPKGTHHYLGILSATDPDTGIRHATRKGPVFITSMFESFAPGSITGTWLASGGTWGIVRAHHHRAPKLRKRVRHFQQLLGLKRLSIIETGRGDTPEAIAADEFHKAVHVLLFKSSVANYSGDTALIHVAQYPLKAGQKAFITSLFPNIAMTFAPLPKGPKHSPNPAPSS